MCGIAAHLKPPPFGGGAERSEAERISGSGHPTRAGLEPAPTMLKLVRKSTHKRVGEPDPYAGDGHGAIHPTAHRHPR